MEDQVLNFSYHNGGLSLAAVLLVLIGVASCDAAHAAPPAAGGQPGTTNAVEIDVAEAAFRHLFAHNESGAQSEAAFFCVGQIRAKKFAAVSDELLHRLQSSSKPVVNYGDCPGSKDSSIRSPKAPGTGLIFFLDAIHCSSNSACEVTGGYYEGNLSSSKNTLKLVKEGGGWVVQEDRLDSIS
jgi:hypothetical protein